MLLNFPHETRIGEFIIKKTSTNHSWVYKVYMSSQNNTDFNISDNQMRRGSETKLTILHIYY